MSFLALPNELALHTGCQSMGLAIDIYGSHTAVPGLWVSAIRGIPIYHLQPYSITVRLEHQ